MAGTGRIGAADKDLVRERSPIADVVGEHLQLRGAGGGSLKGLCPLHEEKTPSFTVSPARGLFYCFGCGVGGDVFEFVQRVEQLSFVEAVEKLAARSGVQLHYEQGGTAPRQQAGLRSRLAAAHAAAAEFFAGQLASSPDAAAGRRFLAERGFDAAATAQFGVGYAPRGWDSLLTALRGRGFSGDELIAGGLARQGQRGPYDYFRGRLVWPIRDRSGEVVGFGARRLHDDDPVEAKYLNTPETPIFKKSRQLYGVDLAKRDIARRLQAVVVEGYTDVMACHLAGVPTAVATCGTAFGADHIAVLRQLLMDQDEFRGEVIFTFDGDEAGQRAALKAFDDDQRFVAQTFVAVEPSGLDPCELRVARGDAAVRDLVARREPLFEFAIRSTVNRFNLETTEGRLAAVDAAAPIVARIRDHGLRQRYAVNLDRWLGFLDEDFVLRRVREAGTRAGQRRPAPPASNGRPSAPDPRDPRLLVEREAAKLALQQPALATPGFADLPESGFTSPAYAAVRVAIATAGGTVVGGQGGDAAWVERVRAAAADDRVRSLVTELAVEPLRTAPEAMDRYAVAVLARLEEIAATRRIAEVKSRLQRLNPLEQTDAYNKLFGELVVLEKHKRDLRERSIGEL